MKVRPRVLAALGLSCLLAQAPGALAWNASGHMQIALLVYDSLPAPTREQLDELLSHHPRLAQDLVPQIPAGAEQEARGRWLFALASTWPDVARGQPEYDHRNWHYVNLQLHLRSGGLVSCKEARDLFERAGQREVWAGDSAAPQSILGATAWAERTWADFARPLSERALALSWLLHLVADAHQPLHGVALFTAKRFQTGDRGGNDVILRGRGSLHRVWDDLLGDGTAPDFLSAALTSLQSDRYLMAVAARAAEELSVDRWIDEDCAVARSAVYVPAVLDAVRRFESRPHDAGDKPEVALREAYVKAAAATARRRAVQAAARLRALLMARAAASVTSPKAEPPVGADPSGAQSPSLQR